MRITLLTVLFIMTAPQFAVGQMLSPKPQLTPVPDGVEFDYERWPYPLYDEIVERVKLLAERYPNLAEMHNIGKSRAGRDLWSSRSLTKRPDRETISRHCGSTAICIWQS